MNRPQSNNYQKSTKNQNWKIDLYKYPKNLKSKDIDLQNKKINNYLQLINY